MKILNFILVCTITFIFAVSCNEGIDPISSVEPGTDEVAPTLTISSPSEGDVLKLAEGSDLKVMMAAADDIELQSVSIMLDGAEAKNLTSFMDYRRYSPINGVTLGAVANGGHTLKVTATDLTGKSTSSPVINFSVINIAEFVPSYGEIFYMSFDNTVFEFASLTEASIIGTASYAEGKIGQAFAGSTDSYLSFPLDALANEEFSATFWININPDPDRSGMLTVSAPDASGNNRNFGFRIFREGTSTSQIIKLNIGDGTVDGWLDGGALATVNPEAFTIGTDHAALYLDGVSVSELDFGPVDWTNCDQISIASGEPNFTGWSHFSDLSLYDELRIFDKALTQEEIQAIIDDEL